MHKKTKIEYWLDIADYDIKTAEAMLKSKRYLYVVFMCQQAIEKIIKAIFIQENDKEPPRTHNLIYLSDLLNINLSDIQINLLEDLSSYYIAGRYPEYKQKLSGLIKNGKCNDIFKSSKEFYKWLKFQLKKNRK